MSDYHDIDIENCGTEKEIKDAIEQLEAEAATHESAITDIDIGLSRLNEKLERLIEQEYSKSGF